MTNISKLPAPPDIRDMGTFEVKADAWLHHMEKVLPQQFSQVSRDIYGTATFRSHSRTCSYCKSEATISTHCKNCGAPA